MEMCFQLKNFASTKSGTLALKKNSKKNRFRMLRQKPTQVLL